MPLAHWEKLPTQYVHHNSIIGSDDDRHVVRGLRGFLLRRDGWIITAANVDNSDFHLQSVSVDDGDLFFHTGTVANRTTEEIECTATRGTLSVYAIMLIVIDKPPGSGGGVPGITGTDSTVPGPTGPESTTAGITGKTGADSTEPGPVSTVPGITGPESTTPGITGPAGKTGADVQYLFSGVSGITIATHEDQLGNIVVTVGLAP